MPARRRKPWVRFVKRTQAVLQKAIAPVFQIRLRSGQVSSAANKQGIFSPHTILGSYSTDNSTNDIDYLHDRVSQLAATGEFEPDKFMVTGWLAETQIINEGATTAYIDMYYWRCKHSVPLTVGVSTGATATTAASIMEHSLFALHPVNPLGGSGLDVTDYGVTPFQGVNFAKMLNIYKKVRVKLAVGGVTQVEQRSGRNYFLDTHFAGNYGMLRGKSEGILMIFYGVPTDTFTTAAPAELRFSTNVNYTVRLMKSATTAGGTNQL